MTEPSMINPFPPEEVLQKHLEGLSEQAKREMFVEMLEAMAEVCAPNCPDQAVAVTLTVYSAQLWLAIFKELYTNAEAQLENSDHLENCFKK